MTVVDAVDHQLWLDRVAWLQQRRCPVSMSDFLHRSGVTWDHEKARGYLIAEAGGWVHATWWFQDIPGWPGPEHGGVRLQLPSAEAVLARALSGLSEYYDRKPYMGQKHSTANDCNRDRWGARGMILEHVVRGWFEVSYPGLVGAADNEGDVTTGCAHDFKLTIAGREVCVDVSGQNKYGAHEAHARKRKTDLHLTVFLDDDGSVRWDGVVPGHEFEGKDVREKKRPPDSLLVRLNMELAGVPHGLFPCGTVPLTGG